MTLRVRKKKQEKVEMKRKEADPLERVRRICAALPGTTEKLSHGEPTFFIRKGVVRVDLQQPSQ